MKLSVHYLIGPSLKRVKDETAGKETLPKAKKAKTSSIAYFFSIIIGNSYYCMFCSRQ